jgi:hypothetical protein
MLFLVHNTSLRRASCRLYYYRLTGYIANLVQQPLRVVIQKTAYVRSTRMIELRTDHKGRRNLSRCHTHRQQVAVGRICVYEVNFGGFLWECALLLPQHPRTFVCSQRVSVNSTAWGLLMLASWTPRRITQGGRACACTRSARPSYSSTRVPWSALACGVRLF